MTVVAVVDQLSDLNGPAPEWDALAVGASDPLSTPAWMLGWWRHAAPAGASLHVVTVRDDDRLVGIAPFWRTEGAGGTSRLGLLAGGDFSASVAILAAKGREREVAGTVGAALMRSGHRPDLLEIGPAVRSKAWPAALRAGLGGRPRPLLLEREPMAAPIITLAGVADFDQWLAARGRSFRSNFRRRTRWLEEAGGEFRCCTPETVDADIDTFVRLHSDRWRDLGTSRMVAMGDDLSPMLRQMAKELGAGDRFRLYVLDIDGGPAAIAFYIETGGEVALINTGWDEAHHRLAPLQLLQGHTIRDSLARGDWRITLGHGASQAKLSVADADEPVVDSALVPWGPRAPAALFEARTMVRRCAQDRLRDSISEERFDQLRDLKRRVAPG